MRRILHRYGCQRTPSIAIKVMIMEAMGRLFVDSIHSGMHVLLTSPLSTIETILKVICHPIGLRTIVKLY